VGFTYNVSNSKNLKKPTTRVRIAAFETAKIVPEFDTQGLLHQECVQGQPDVQLPKWPSKYQPWSSEALYQPKK
jgi:hypothetical protein